DRHRGPEADPAQRQIGPPPAVRRMTGSGQGAPMQPVEQDMQTAAQVVAFWTEAGPAKWFARDEAFDARFRALFLEEHHAAASRAREHWLSSAEGALALMLLLDQFPRNCF